MDRLDEKFTGEIREANRAIKELDEKLTGQIKALDEKFTEKFGALQLWVIGTLITLIVGFGGIIASLLRR